MHSEIAGHTAHYGWEGTLLIDPMLRLYQATGDKKYLEWSQWVVANMDKWSGWNSFSKLDQVADGKLGVHQLQPYVHSHTFQMNFLGFLRLYQITGDASLLRKVRGAWDDVAARQLYITGGVSVGEHYEPGYRRPLTGHVVETCANMSWMELTQYLLELTGEAALRRRHRAAAVQPRLRLADRGWRLLPLSHAAQWLQTRRLFPRAGLLHGQRAPHRGDAAAVLLRGGQERTLREPICPLDGAAARRPMARLYC